MTKHTSAQATDAAAEAARPPYERYTAALRRMQNDLPPAPVALLDLTAFCANAADMTRRAAGTPIRVASKSLRIRRAIETALAEPGYSGVMSFTLAEALWLQECGHTDLLVAYPTVDRQALSAWVRSAEARREITVMVDSMEHLELIEDIQRKAGLHPEQFSAEMPPLRICLDLDAAWQPTAFTWFRFGALRSPVKTAKQARVMAEKIIGTPGCALVGVLAYEGQVAGLPEGGGLRSLAIRGIKAASVRDLSSRRVEMVAAIREVAERHGVELEFVNGGGTGSIETTVGEGAVTEIGAGSGLMGPASFDGFMGFDVRPASFFICPVARRTDPTIVTVTGGGWIASGVPGPDRSPTVAWPKGLTYSGQEGAGEVQTPLRGPGARALKLGDPVFFRHAKAGEPAEHLAAVAVYSQADDEIVDVWPTYRGEGQVFL